MPCQNAICLRLEDYECYPNSPVSEVATSATKAGCDKIFGEEEKEKIIGIGLYTALREWTVRLNPPHGTATHRLRNRVPP